MSRIGNKPIDIPANVKVQVMADKVLVQGPKGEEQAPVFSGITVNVEAKQVTVKLRDEKKSGEKSLGKDKKLRAIHGLSRSLINNCIIGTSLGFKKELEIKGVGYRVAQKGSDLQFQLGFSHDVIYKIPAGIEVKLKSQTEIEVSGTNKEKVGQTAAEIRNLKKPEPYKGKGIRYKNEQIRMKAGKAGK